MNADQKWGSGVLVLKPEMGRGGTSQRVTYDMKKGKEVNLRYETKADEETSMYSTTESEESSSLDMMGVTFILKQASGSELLSEKGDEEQEAKINNMLSSDLMSEEREEYITMLKRYPNMFIIDYSQIKGVTVIEHKIELRPETKLVAQKLRRMGVIQRSALLAEVNKLLKAGFIIQSGSPL